MEPPFVQSFFDMLKGSWKLTKNILPQGHFEGTAQFEQRAQDQFLYTEFGTLYLPQGTFENSGNQYLYQMNAGTIEVHFFGFRTGLFQALQQTDSNILFGKHLCGDDLYTSTYEIIDAKGFSLRHKVKGPKKDYTIDAEFRR